VAESSIERIRRAMRLQDPGDALRAIAELRRELRSLEELHVENALQAGWSWGEIGAALGTTKQGAHKRHASRIRAGRSAPESSRGEASRVIITGEARRCVALARREAESRGSPALRTEHLLLGLLAEEGTLASRALGEAGIRLAVAQGAAEGSPADGSAAEAEPPERLPISRPAREVLERSLGEAVELGDRHLGAEHILLALLRSDGGSAARMLAALGGDRAAIQAAVRRLRSAAPDT
jgi:Clp amino terminal domain, pathogenicity island component